MRDDAPVSDREPSDETKDLLEGQQQREAEEREATEESHLEDEAAQHKRRADKAAYLREKLEERAEAEREDY
jgi:hypothetical protein